MMWGGPESRAGAETETGQLGHRGGVAGGWCQGLTGLGVLRDIRRWKSEGEEKKGTTEKKMSDDSEQNATGQITSVCVCAT